MSWREENGKEGREGREERNSREGEREGGSGGCEIHFCLWGEKLEASCDFQDKAGSTILSQPFPPFPFLSSPSSPSLFFPFRHISFLLCFVPFPFSPFLCSLVLVLFLSFFSLVFPFHVFNSLSLHYFFPSLFVWF